MWVLLSYSGNLCLGMLNISAEKILKYYNEAILKSSTKNHSCLRDSKLQAVNVGLHEKKDSLATCFKTLLSMESWEEHIVFMGS